MTQEAKKSFNEGARYFHYGLPVSDLKKSMDFYREWCDLHPMAGYKKGASVVKLTHPGGEEEVLVLMNYGPKRFEDKQEEFTGRHFGFRIESVERLQEICEKAENDNLICWEMDDKTIKDDMFFMIKDPDGYIVEFSSPKAPEQNLQNRHKKLPKQKPGS